MSSTLEQAIPLLEDLDSPCDSSSLARSVLALPEHRLSKQWTQFCRLWLRLLVSLLPKYMQPGGRSKGELPPTAYLDALRGYAALIVFFYHSFPLPSTWLFQQTFFRVFFRGGPGMVAVFFVISGYVLSYRMLKAIRNKDPIKLLDSLASSTFRRWFRLYGSTGVATFVAMVLTQLGWFWPHASDRKETFLEQVWDWFQDWLESSDPFANIQGWIHGWAFRSRYLYQMWTIPVEYRGSIALFVFCAAACKLSSRSRMVFLWLVVLLSYYWRAVYIAEFLIGMFIADLSLIRHPERLGRRLLLPTPPGPAAPETSSSSSSIEKPIPNPTWRRWLFGARRHGLASKIGWGLVSATGFYLLSQPDDPDSNTELPTPWPTLLGLVPWWYGEAMYTFWVSIGAGLLVLGLDNSPTLQTPFTWSFSQYLGDLSFGIYAMHIIVLESLFKPVLNPWREVHLGESAIACFVIEVVGTAAVIWAADYFTRADKLVVRFGRWIEVKTFEKW
ncbi:hypothetical protein AYO20_02834 [Fonsecaea nubica]|uniref:Acyltransferase 3 domain-containing protein n=1 Tax=Fonsecaea nubica TaxID=856822 RepID=A0A178D9U0_9EURO|nr:hypothetical protein AYO20_02834 [Fonsecaea nubica]OAL38001.1 hypothetical protein AYO20_02834 [Fonsecaea nubica]